MQIKTKEQKQILIVISMAKVKDISLDDILSEIRLAIEDEDTPAKWMPFHRGFGRSSSKVAKYLNGIKSKFKCFVFVGSVSPAVRIAAHTHKIDLECFFVDKAPCFDPQTGDATEDEWAEIGHILPNTVD